MNIGQTIKSRLKFSIIFLAIGLFLGSFQYFFRTDHEVSSCYVCSNNIPTPALLDLLSSEGVSAQLSESGNLKIHSVSRLRADYTFGEERKTNCVKLQLIHFESTTNQKFSKTTLYEIVNSEAEVEVVEYKADLNAARQYKMAGFIYWPLLGFCLYLLYSIINFYRKNRIGVFTKNGVE